MAPRIGAKPKRQAVKRGPIGRAADAAKLADDIVNGTGKTLVKGAAGVPDEIQESFIQENEGPFRGGEMARFGANEPTPDEIRGWAQKWIAQEAVIKSKMEIVKEERSKKKILSKQIQGALITMTELKQAIAEMQEEEVDQIDRQRRLNYYRQALGVPVIGRDEPTPTASLDPAKEAKRYERQGYQDGIKGLPRQAPDSVPPEFHQAYYGGHEKGQTGLMKRSPLTKDGFNEPEAAALAQPTAHPAIVTLNEAHFAPQTEMDDANLSTLLEAHRGAFDAAERVVVLFQTPEGPKRRTIKEPDDSFEGGFYIDSGDPDVAIYEAEDAELEPASFG